MQRIRIIIHGAVQGVGFRPFVYRLAKELKLNGWVLNSSQGVFIEADGYKEILDDFVFRIEKERPSRSYIQSLEFSFLDPAGYNDFNIRTSDDYGNKSVLMLPDIATCPDCLNDIFDLNNRRYLYPFTNCTNCGPRFSIIEKLPYDRKNTTMANFIMCDDCRAEYEDPLNRRFHAQPNACPKCGPHIELWNTQGKALAMEHDALIQTAEEIKNGKILAVKGIGGFHLIADARNNVAVKRLRNRKHREEKPLALMMPDLPLVKEYCEVSDYEIRLLQSPESPIVLLEKKNISSDISESIAPDNPYLGVMLPYSPLHHILMKELGFPIVATSGNISDEPICIDENEALKRLAEITDLFLVHNRPIKRHVDDSIVRIILDREMVVRRARGYAPLPVRINASKKNILAVGGHIKNTIALSIDKNIFISQHIGDLETKEAYDAFENVISDFEDIYDVMPVKVVSDMHPNYISTQFAQNLNIPVNSVQHHYAHVLSCMSENGIDGNVLGVSWDGTGYGTDGTIWGGEFLIVDDKSFKRFAHLRQFRLPGGEIAIKEIWRTVAGLLFEIFGSNFLVDKSILSFKDVPEVKLKMMKKMLEHEVNSPSTSSAGRLFDAVASITGMSQYSHFEGQAAMMLEFSTGHLNSNEIYTFRILENRKDEEAQYILDWEPMIREILTDIKNIVDNHLIAAKFHNTLTDMIVGTAKRSGKKKIVLSGGCFQNKYLLERTVNALLEARFTPYWHQRVPTNDGGISLGQVIADLRNSNLE
jgi:hydrogenase maturation protein HypF